ncbi:MAG: carbohydrate-binding family 9-like protein, partial [Armatimonadota bacterium]|nr:carbohydrate-binding family 9-like protein [Armatimonadota bacterium]
MFHDKDEGSFGILVPSRTVEETELARKHRVVLTDLSPGTNYVLQVVQDRRVPRLVCFATPDPCPGDDWPRITVTTPPYGGDVASNPAAYQVNWTGNLPEGTEVTVFADTDERELDGTEVGHGTVGPGGAGSATVDLSSLPNGAYYLYCVASAAHCSVPDGRVWDYSSGRVVIPAAVLDAGRLPHGQGIEIDGDLEPVWDAVPWTLFATHPAQNGNTTAQVKLLWDADNLYAAFDVSDTQVETSSADDTWDSDSVSIWLSFGLPMDGCVHPAECSREYRQGPCDGGSSMPGVDAAWSLKPATTCGNNADTDAGYWVEMRIPWKDLHVAPVAGLVLSADLLSVDHDNNPGAGYDAPGTVFSKIFWDGDGPDYLRGAVRLGD